MEYLPCIFRDAEAGIDAVSRDPYDSIVFSDDQRHAVSLARRYAGVHQKVLEFLLTRACPMARNGPPAGACAQRAARLPSQRQARHSSPGHPARKSAALGATSAA